MSLYLDITDNRTNHRPGEAVTGVAGWELDARPASAQVCLLWHTSGKGDRDVGVVDRIQLTPAGPADAQPYRLQLPDEPYSFVGRLITLTWSIELIVEPGHQVKRIDLSMSPTGEAVTLGSSDIQPRSSIFEVE